MWTWRRAVRRLWPQLAQCVVLNALMWITGDVAWGIASIGFSTGWVVAAMRSYREGMNDREEITRKIFGELWAQDAITGAYVRGTREKAERN